MKNIVMALLLAAFVASCGTKLSNNDAGDLTGLDVPDIAVTDNVTTDAVADVRHDIAPDTTSADVSTDIPDNPDIRVDAIADVATDLATDLPLDVQIPAGCCLTDNDCDGRCVGTEAHDFGLCVESPLTGRCWTDDDCELNEACHGAAFCPCELDCGFQYTGPGVCVLEGQTCVTVPVSEILETCDAANLFIFDGQSCVGTCSGCCGCGPWCDFTFATMQDCETACTPVENPVDRCQSEADLALIHADQADIRSHAQSCTLSCMGDPNAPACAAQCTTDATDLSPGCAACYSGATVCMMNKCTMPCMTDPSSASCMECQETEGCTPTFETCRGAV